MPNKQPDEATPNFPVLIGDIGGTNARFAIVIDANSEPKRFDTFPTARYETINEGVQTEILDKTSLLPKSAVIAVAGPVDGDEIPLTNCPWVVKPKTMLHDLGLTDIVILNDFEAQALAAVALGDDSLVQIGGGKPDAYASRVVLGPGTGLGVAGLVHARNAWIPVAGEGGHIDVGPRNARDAEFFPHLVPIEGRISAEQILCGRGIVHLYRAICAADGVEPSLALPRDDEEKNPPDPAPVTAAGLKNANPQAAETLRTFVRILGQVAGDIALVFKARGGVFISGGIGQKLIEALKWPEFASGFEDKAPHSRTLMAPTPRYVITHPTAALEGLACFARTPTRFGLSTEGRRWRE